MSSDLKDARWQLADDLTKVYNLRYPTGNYAADSKVRDIAAAIISSSLESITLVKTLAHRWNSEEQEEPMAKSPSTPAPHDVRWGVLLDGQAQKLVSRHDDTSLDGSIKTLAQDLQVSEVKELLQQFDAEIIRLDEMKAQVISAKKQLKAAIFND